MFHISPYLWSPKVELHLIPVADDFSGLGTGFRIRALMNFYFNHLKLTLLVRSRKLQHLSPFFSLVGLILWDTNFILIHVCEVGKHSYVTVTSFNFRLSAMRFKLTSAFLWLLVMEETEHWSDQILWNNWFLKRIDLL